MISTRADFPNKNPKVYPAFIAALKVAQDLFAKDKSSATDILKWSIFQNKNMLEIPNVFAGLLAVIIFGLLVKNLIFKVVENVRSTSGTCILNATQQTLVRRQ